MDLLLVCAALLFPCEVTWGRGRLALGRPVITVVLDWAISKARKERTSGLPQDGA